jgi:hypothetical protein
MVGAHGCAPLLYRSQHQPLHALESQILPFSPSDRHIFPQSAIATHPGLPLTSHSWKATDDRGDGILPKSGGASATHPGLPLIPQEITKSIGSDGMRYINSLSSW